MTTDIAAYTDEEENTAKTVEEYLNEVNYEIDNTYIPSDFSLKFVNLIKLVEGGRTENVTPVVHYRMADKYVNVAAKDIINLCHRGLAKTTLFEYLILYIAVFGVLEGFGKVPYMLYVSDSMDNGVKKMRKSLELRYENSDFLKKYITHIRFTDTTWEFHRENGTKLVVTGHGAKTGVRGTRENNSRPVIALLDDLISDLDAKSPTVIQNIENTVYNAIDYALHPKRRRIIWNGTPFNARDPLYKAVESGAWAVNVFPVCEKFPCSREEFRGSWVDRFDYDYVNKQYNKALKLGKIDTFNQELMLRIMSEEDRLIQDAEIKWYSRQTLLSAKGNYNYYITTDFATKDKAANDFSVISVWAYNNAGHWFWVDGVCAKQKMDQNIDDLFRLAQEYKPMSVGIEVSGQQQGFVSWIKTQMLARNIFFPLASDKNSGVEGINPTGNKHQRFVLIQPWFKAGIMNFPEEMRNSFAMLECMDELKLVSMKGFKSKHDDFADTISMLAVMPVFKPSTETINMKQNADGIWEDWEDDDEPLGISSYVV